jgi:hypothetical protein
MSRRKRSTKSAFKLFRRDVDGWVVLRRIDFGEGERLVLSGRMERVFDGDKHVGYRPRQRSAAMGRFTASPSRPSSSVFSRIEVQAIAGSLGRSETSSMAECEKLLRVHPRRHHPEAEDLIERSRAKLEEWTEPHDDHAIRVYPPRPAKLLRNVEAV